MTDDLITRLKASLDDEERIALAASSEWDRDATEPEHWRWECEADDTPLDPDLAIASGEEFLDHGEDHYRIGLRSLETYQTSVRPLEHLALGGCEEVRPQVARHIARQDPARTLAKVNAVREILAEHPNARDVLGPLAPAKCMRCFTEGRGGADYLDWPCSTVRALAAAYGVGASEKARGRG